jgi:hypothetical protein
MTDPKRHLLVSFYMDRLAHSVLTNKPYFALFELQIEEDSILTKENRKNGAGYGV